MKRIILAAFLLIILSVPVLGHMVTTSNTPAIYIDFTSENDRVTILEASVLPASGSAINVMSNIHLQYRNYFLLNSPRLRNGDYTLRVKAEDDIGNAMTNYATFNFSVNNMTSDVLFTVQPLPLGLGKVISKDTFNITVRFIQKPVTYQVRLSGPEDTKDITMQKVDDLTYRKLRQLAPVDGSYRISASATVDGRPPLSGEYAFAVNARPPLVKLFRPKYGIVNVPKFDLIFKTDELATCRYMTGVFVPYRSMNQLALNTTGSFGYYHKKTDFTGIPSGGNVTVYVMCNDSLGRIMPDSARFSIGYDITPPILNVTAAPAVVYNSPFKSKLKVYSDDPTICKYDYEAGFATLAKMRYSFRGYDIFNYSKTHFQMLEFSPDTKSYTYYVACENPVGGKSPVAVAAISVNRLLELTIEDNTPRWVNKTGQPIMLSVITNRNDSTCFYTEDQNKLDTPQANAMGDNEYVHTVGIIKPEGDYTFYVKCYSTTRPAITLHAGKDTTAPTKPVVNDSTGLSNPAYTWLNDELTGKWSSKDNQSGISGYRVAVFAKANDQKLTNWIFTKSGKKTFDSLDLDNLKSYYFGVYAVNGAGSWSKEMGKSDGVTVDASKQPSACENGRLDIGIETDVDCGKSCPKCAVGKTCAVDIDCSTGHLCNPTTKKCAASTCSDKKKGPAESDVDCGGSCTAKCASGKNCTTVDDCAAGLNCGQGGKCELSYADICSNGKLDVEYESDVDCGKRCAINYGKRCDADLECESNNDCFSKKCQENGQCMGAVDSTDVDGDGVLDTKDNCPTKNNPGQENMDADGKGDACDDDIDGDGIPDAIELANGLNPKDKTDAKKDNDGDGVSNFDELVTNAKYRMDPNKKDTDGDGFNDFDEIKAGTHPNDAKSKPGKFPLLLIIIFIIIILVIVVLFLAFKPAKKTTEERKQMPMASPGFPPRQMGPVAVIPPRFFVNAKPVEKKMIVKPAELEDMRKSKERILREFSVTKGPAGLPKKEAKPAERVGASEKQASVKIIKPKKEAAKPITVKVATPVIFNAAPVKAKPKPIKKTVKKPHVSVSVTIHPEGKKG